MMTQPNTPKPAALLPFNPAGIPASLKEEPRWAPWVAVWNDKRKKYDKIPKRADMPNVGLSTAKPQNWFTYAAALDSFNRNPGLFAGLGYVVTGAQNLVATDIDHCITDGIIADWAQDIVNDLSTYTEISPSGTGLRLFSAGTLDNDFQNHDVGLEVYAGKDARFLTVSGQRLDTAPEYVRPAPGGVLLAMQSQYAKVRTKATIIDLNLPEQLDELALPSLSEIELPPRVRDWLESGECIGDRSGMLHQSGIALYSAGLSDAEVFSTLANNDHALEVALDHRHQDTERALMYLWREQCVKAKPKAESLRVASMADFDDESDVAPATSAAPAAVAKVKGLRFQPVQAGSFIKRDPIRWAVKKVFPLAEIGVIYGESGAGKSFFALDMVMAIVRGVPWRGHRVRKCNVVYICAEGATGFAMRMQAYAEFHGVVLAEQPLHIIEDAPNFMEKADVKDLIAAIKSLGHIDIVVVDTLTQVTAGADENSSQDMGRAVAHCKAIFKATGAMITLIAHAGKDVSRGIRGWSGLKAPLDVSICVERSGDNRCATVVKTRDGEGEGVEHPFILDVVTLYTDEDGDPVTSCVVKEGTARVGGGGAGLPPIATNATWEQAVIRVAVDLTDLASDVTTNQLIEATINQIPRDEAAKKDRRRERVIRAITTLVASGHLIQTAGMVTVP